MIAQPSHILYLRKLYKISSNKQKYSYLCLNLYNFMRDWKNQIRGFSQNGYFGAHRHAIEHIRVNQCIVMKDIQVIQVYGLSLGCLKCQLFAFNSCRVIFTYYRRYIVIQLLDGVLIYKNYLVMVALNLCIIGTNALSEYYGCTLQGKQ